MSGTFTGRHMLGVMLGGFAVIIGVNLTLATLASRSHPGMVVENSYIASQKFNGWLAEGRAQKALGWTAAAEIDGALVRVEVAGPGGAPLPGLKANVRFVHPLGSGTPRDVALVEAAPGVYAAPHGLAPGQWQADVRLTRGNDRFYLPARLVVPG